MNFQRSPDSYSMGTHKGIYGDEIALAQAKRARIKVIRNIVFLSLHCGHYNHCMSQSVRGQLVKMAITLELHGIFGSKFAYLCMSTLSNHWQL